jgi:hypothetical protein
VEAIFSLAHTLGVRTVAEGVEEGGQIELLRRWGCTTVQGFGLSRPKSPEDAALSMSQWLEPVNGLEARLLHERADQALLSPPATPSKHPSPPPGRSP